MAAQRLSWTFGALIVTLIGLERLGAWTVEGAPTETLPKTQRAAHVEIVSKNPANLPRRAGGASLFLIGNSHTYALPGLNKGEPLRADPGVTLIDELARELVTRSSSRAAATYYRLSNPNFLPFEILSRTAHLIDRGYSPDVVVLGLTWRNLARDTALRHEIHRIYADAAFVERFRASLIAAGAPPALLTAIAAEARQAAFEDRVEKERSDADRLDAVVMEHAGDYVSLIGSSAELRARLYRSLVYKLDEIFFWRTANASQDVIEKDLSFNLDCLKVLIRFLAARNIALVLYRAPERSDLPPIVDVDRADRVMAELTRYVAQHGGVMIDARRVVPDEFWGWERETPDRSHFTEPGHQRLGQFIAAHPDAQRLFQRLDRP